MIFTPEQLKLIDGLISKEIDRLEAMINDTMETKYSCMPALVGLLNHEYLNNARICLPKLVGRYEMLSTLYEQLGDVLFKISLEQK